MSERTTWVRVEGFAEPVDEAFRVLDAFMRTAGVAVQRFVAGPAEQALYVERLPWEEDQNWQLDPALHAGPALLCSEATSDEACEQLYTTLGGPETLQWRWLCPVKPSCGCMGVMSSPSFHSSSPLSILNLVFRT